MYFEWDVPVIINGPFINNAGSFWVKCWNPLLNGNENKSKFDADLVNTSPWKDIPL